MPRNLPWLNNDKTVKAEPKATPASKRRHQGVSSDIEDDLDKGSASTKGGAKARASSRMPSSSPPPMQPAPPREEYMKEGLAGDDIWMMVEDEFLATAHLFTQHLHRAEYQRLKQIAKERNANMMHTLSRPVDPRAQLSVEAKKRQEAEAMAKLQRDSIGKLGGGKAQAKTDEELLDEEFEDPWLQDSHLAGLMSGSQVETARLDGIMGVKSNTRAAAGYSKASSDRSNLESIITARTTVDDACTKPKKRLVIEGDETATEDEDDLSAPRRAAPKPSNPSASRHTASATESHQMRPPEKKPPDRSTQTSAYPGKLDARRSGPSQRSVGDIAPLSKRARPKPPEDDDIGIRPRRERLSAGFAARMAKRKAEMAARKERDEKGKNKSILLDEIPTFLV